MTRIIEYVNSNKISVDEMRSSIQTAAAAELFKIIQHRCYHVAAVNFKTVSFSCPLINCIRQPESIRHTN